MIVEVQVGGAAPPVGRGRDCGIRACRNSVVSVKAWAGSIQSNSDRYLELYHLAEARNMCVASVTGTCTLMVNHPTDTLAMVFSPLCERRPEHASHRLP